MVASRTEGRLIYCTGVVQGVALVTFPAAGAIFTSPDGFGFDSTRYGTLFVPQVVLAVVASALAPRLARQWGLRQVLLAGLAGDIVSMTLLAFGRLLLGVPDTAFATLLVATAALGFGFGATVMALDTYVEAFFPERRDRAVLMLNALLGLGTALAPLLVAIVVAAGAWWLLPVLVTCVLLLIFGIASGQPLRASAETAGASTTKLVRWTDLPRRFWLYAAAVFLYGILETLNGNWAILYLTSERGISARGASLALAAFWSMVTLGRLLIAVISRWVPARWIYLGLSILLILALQLAARVKGETEGILAFGIAGLACSAFLPLSISFGSNEFPQLSALVTGGLIAFYQLGYGVGAFGLGPLRDPVGVPFSTIFAGSGIIAVLLIVISWLVIRRKQPNPFVAN